MTERNIKMRVLRPNGKSFTAHFKTVGDCQRFQEAIYGVKRNR